MGLGPFRPYNSAGTCISKTGFQLDGHAPHGSSEDILRHRTVLTASPSPTPPPGQQGSWGPRLGGDLLFYRLSSQTTVGSSTCSCKGRAVAPGPLLRLLGTPVWTSLVSSATHSLPLSLVIRGAMWAAPGGGRVFFRDPSWHSGWRTHLSLAPSSALCVLGILGISRARGQEVLRSRAAFLDAGFWLCRLLIPLHRRLVGSFWTPHSALPM